MKLIGVIVAGTLLACSASAIAQAPKSKKEANDPDRMICRTQEMIGTRLSKVRLCHTAAEWDEIKRSERISIERMQANRTKSQ